MGTRIRILGIFLLIASSCIAINPPGTKKVKIDKETIYIDKKEITYQDWREYVFSLENAFGRNSDEVKAALPQGFNLETSIKDLFIKETSEKPLTGITFEQAVNYCEWRTNVVNIINEETGRANVKYSLPTEEQYSKLIKIFGAYEILSEKNRTERLSGLQSSVYELTAEKSVLKNNGTFSKDENIPNNKCGFRCVAITIKR